MRILAVSSGGGHWIELLRLRPAFDGHDIHFLTVNQSYDRDISDCEFTVIRDATRQNPFVLIILLCQLLRIISQTKPHIVVSTGAAPGLLAMAVGKLFGAKTIWVDSVANVDELSGSGRLARAFADLWLTQWEHLASQSGPEYAGKVF